MEGSGKRPRKQRNVIRFGYVRLLDAAPIVMAQTLGLFREAGLTVKLHREPGWATIRDKLAFEDLDVAQTLSPMPFVMQLGIGVRLTEAITGMILNCNGNAITLSSALAKEGIEDGPTLKRYLKKGYRTRKPVLGVVSLHSSHHFMLCRWLEQNGLDPRKDVVVAVLPPEQMVRNLASNNIDGFCAGEPWNSIAVAEEHGWVAATGEEILPGYPEKVVTTTTRFSAYHPDEYLALIRALDVACAYCDAEENRREVADILAGENYLNCPAELLEVALGESFPVGNGVSRPGRFIRFHGEDLHRPTLARAETVFNDLVRYVARGDFQVDGRGLIGRTYRESLYAEAMASARPTA